MRGPVHFIHLGGELCWQHYRAIRTAHVHTDDVWFWTAGDVLPTFIDELHHSATETHPVEWNLDLLADPRPLDLPDWLRDHPIRLANVKDLYMWRILHDHGGLYLDLDTISLRPAWDLLDGCDVCVSTEFPAGQEAGRPHNTAAVIARQGAPILLEMHAVAEQILRQGEDTWGAVGPHLVSDFIRSRSGEAWDFTFTAAPYPLLNGWSYHSIGDYYREPRDPGGGVRVIHLYSSDHLAAFHADRWMP